MRPHLLLACDFPPASGGVARFMGELTRRYPPGRLIVSTGQEPETEDVDALYPNRVDRLPIATRRLRALPGMLLWSRHATMLARTNEAEFVWCGNLKPSAYPAKWVYERLGTPFGVLAYGNDLLLLQHQLHQSPVRRRAARALIGSVAVFVVNSEWTRQLCLTLLRELGIEHPETRVRNVPLGTDPAFFRPGVDTSQVRARYGLEEGRWIVSVARLVPHKGIDTALQALALLQGTERDVRYAVAGEGPGRKELERLVRELKLEGRVRFLTGVPDADLPALYNLAQVSVGVSRRTAQSVDSFGLSLAEAQSSGVPVVAGRSGGVPEAVRNGETGLLVEPESAEETADAIRALLRDPERAQRLGQAGRREIERFYNWDRATKDLLAIAEEFASSGAGAAGPVASKPRKPARR
jgi:phosphatidylinositol alpha-1,6-mannosyltransferase